jgi:hypothetical protein
MHPSKVGYKDFSHFPFPVVNVTSHFLMFLAVFVDDVELPRGISTSRKRGFRSPPLVPEIFEPRLKGALVAVREATRD